MYCYLLARCSLLLALLYIRLLKQDNRDVMSSRCSLVDFITVVRINYLRTTLHLSQHDLKGDDNNNYSCIKWVSRLNVCTFSVMKDFMNRAAFIDIQKGHVLKYVNN